MLRAVKVQQQRQPEKQNEQPIQIHWLLNEDEIKKTIYICNEV